MVLLVTAYVRSLDAYEAFGGAAGGHALKVIISA